METDERKSGPKTIADALADPRSNLNRNLVKVRETMAENDKVIAQWMARGYSREQAWAKALRCHG
jgi:hypothetical protein